MIHWGWLILAIVTSGSLGVVLMACLAAGASEYSWRCGYSEGREEGFQAGLKTKGNKE